MFNFRSSRNFGAEVRWDYRSRKTTASYDWVLRPWPRETTNTDCRGIRETGERLSLPVTLMFIPPVEMRG